MDLDSRIQKMKNVIEKDDIKYPVTEFDPDGTFVDASLFWGGGGGAQRCHIDTDSSKYTQGQKNSQVPQSYFDC